MKKTVLCILLVCSVSSVLPQQRDADIKLKLAQSYERSNNFEQAAKLYEDLYTKDSTNYILFDALRRMYLQLARFKEAVALVSRQLSHNPRDISLLSQLGSTCLLASDEAGATEAWEKAVAVDPKSEMTYRIVCGAMMQSRVFDKAIAMYQRGRKACGNQNLFTNDIAYLHAVMLNYTEATREYLNLLRENANQIGYVQTRIASYTGRAEGRNAATLVVDEAVKGEPKNLQFLQLLAWLSMEGKQFDRAFEIYRKIDELTNARGRELYNFAERILKEKVYETASRAFQEVISNYPKFDLLPMAKFGLARTLEESSTEQDTLRLFGGISPFPTTGAPETEPKVTAAVAAYERIVAEYPKTEIAARALLRIAVLMHEQYFDLDKALSALQTLEQQYAQFSSLVPEAKLRLGDVYLAMGDLDKAEAAYKILVSIRFPNKNERQTAALRLAELAYFRGKFQDALTQLQDLIRDASADVTNDALSLQIFIKEIQQDNESALKTFAKADLLERQHKLSEALTILESIRTTYKGSMIIDETLMSMGDVLLRMKRFTDAIAAYESLVKEFPESIALDRAQMKIAQGYQVGLNDKAHAIAAYQTLLEQYPNSIYASEARKRIRELRGDTL